MSRDGTQIAYWTSGEGPPLVLVHGAAADHTRWRPLLPYLEPHATVHAIDRRGRGASGDGPDYEVAREFEDVAAVVDAVAEASGSPVDLYGHSFGGFCAFGGAMLTLLLTGSDSSDPFAADTGTVAAALPDARVLVLEGHQHVADILAPERFADHVLAFLPALARNKP